MSAADQQRQRLNELGTAPSAIESDLSAEGAVLLRAGGSPDGKIDERSEQRAHCICHEIIQLEEASSRGKLDELKKETAGKAGGSAARYFAECRKGCRDQDAEGDEHEDVFDKKGVGADGGSPCLEQSETDIGTGTRFPGEEGETEEHCGVERDEEQQDVLSEPGLPAGEDAFLL